LLEAHGDLAAALLPSVGGYGKVGRLDLNPLWLGSQGWRDHGKCRNEGKQPTKRPDAKFHKLG
jgi:hypothetical protein